MIQCRFFSLLTSNRRSTMDIIKKVSNFASQSIFLVFEFRLWGGSVIYGHLFGTRANLLSPSKNSLKFALSQQLTTFRLCKFQGKVMPVFFRISINFYEYIIVLICVNFEYFDLRTFRDIFKNNFVQLILDSRALEKESGTV